MAGPVALVARRRHPVPVLWVTFAGTLSGVGHRLGSSELHRRVLRGGHRREALLGLAGAGTLLRLDIWLAPLVYGYAVPPANDALLLAGWMLAVAIAAEATRIRAERVAATRASRQLDQRRQQSEERLRIARDLHDVIGHNISLINVQASMGLDLIDSQPEQARAALTAIKSASKEALQELRTMLTPLRRDDDAAPRSPAPGLDRLPELIKLTRAAGLTVDVEVTGKAPPVPAAVQLAAYRIIQESLTNVARHAGRARVTVRVTYDDANMHVQIDDDGTAPSGGASAIGTGSGITGMRERATALGGDLSAGFRPRRRVPGQRTPSGQVLAMIRVLIADDQSLVRAGFTALLDARDDIEVVGEASDGADAVDLARTLRPDVILMDIRMPGLDGLEATRQIAADPELAGVHVVILTTFGLDEYLFDALRFGASGFLVKDTEPADLATAVRVVAQGDSLISPSMTRKLVAEFASRAKEPHPAAELDAITQREREVMALVADGLTNDEIAQKLYMSPATVRTHVSRAMTKLGVRDRAQLVVLAYETGLVRPNWLT